VEFPVAYFSSTSPVLDWHTAGIFCYSGKQVVSQFQDGQRIFGSQKVPVVPVHTKIASTKAESELAVVVAPQVGKEDQDGSNEILHQLVGRETVIREKGKARYLADTIEKEEAVDWAKTVKWMAVKCRLAEWSHENLLKDLVGEQPANIRACAMAMSADKAQFTLALAEIVADTIDMVQVVLDL